MKRSISLSSSLLRLSLTGALLCLVLLVWGQAPADYYSGAKGTSGKELKTALYQKISEHKVRKYSQLWDDFEETDLRPDGRIWDVYSNVTSYLPLLGRAGSFKKEGDCYNREHSFPKSWFGSDEDEDVYTDLFHIYPTDAYVNGKRANYPFGETNGEIYMSDGSFSKLGESTLDGYEGIVFEPADEYKGDFARSYFYVATAYENRIASWSCDMLAGNAYPAYTDWAVAMLLRWAAEDPVSQKEIDRNNAIYGIQGNRNPYIDFPGLEQYVWGEKSTTAFDPDTYTTAVHDVQATLKPATPQRGVYDVYGRRLRRRSLNAVSATAGLPAGVYVVDGKKMVVK